MLGMRHLPEIVSVEANVKKTDAVFATFTTCTPAVSAMAEKALSSGCALDVMLDLSRIAWLVSDLFSVNHPIIDRKK
jgi:hypothetical protein